MKSELDFNEFEAGGRQQWRKAAELALKGASVEERLFGKTPEGLDIQPIYDALDLDSVSHLGSSPGEKPFVRGRKVSGNKVDRWWIAQEVHCESPEEYNELMLKELMQGRNAVVLPSSRNLSDFGSERAFKAAFEDIDLNIAPLFGWLRSDVSQFITLLDEVVGVDRWRGAVLVDPIGEMLKGETKIDLERCLKNLATAVVSVSGSPGRDVRIVGIQGNLWGDAGANAVDELAYSLATAVEYLKRLSSCGCSVSQLARQFVFSLSLGNDVFMQIAKLRAARLLWSKVFACFSDEPSPLFIHGRSSRFSKSQLDPYSNILRSTVEAFAGVIGGVDSMHIAPYDEVMGGVDPSAKRLARNTQLLLAEECGFAEVTDAVGGSWYVEKLTDQLARKAWERFREVERAGGMWEALKKGEPQNTAFESAAAKIKRMSERSDQMVGVNLSPDLNERFEYMSVDTCSVQKDSGRGEIIPSLSFSRVAQGYELLRDATGKASRRPSIFIAKFGRPKQWSARAEFVKGFLSVGGYKIQESIGGANSYQDALESCLDSGAQVVVLCATDEDYEKIVPEFVPQLKRECPEVVVVLAGNPLELGEEYRNAGVDEFIHLRCGCLSFLDNLNKRLGVLAP